MRTADLKKHMESLPGNQFTQAWTCIEEIDTALGKAGPTAMLALAYTQALQDERVAQLLANQQAQIAYLCSQAENQVAALEEATALAAKLQRKLKKKSKKA